MAERASMNSMACKWKARTTMTAADWNEKRKKDMEGARCLIRIYAT